MKKINQISTKQSNKNSYYRIAVKYDCPYIAQRNGGNREVDSHLSLKCAQQRLLEMFNGGHIADGGEYDALNFKISQMFNRSTTLHYSTKPPLLAMCCYAQVFFTNYL